MAYGLKNNLEYEGHEIELAEDGIVAVRRMRSTEFDLIVLDLRLPRLNGLKVLVYVRARALPLRVIVLSALHEQDDVVRGLKLGADAYVTKPFALKLFLAQVESVLRRPPMDPMNSQDLARLVADLGVEVPDDPTGSRGFYVGETFIDTGARCLYANGERRPLTRHEFDLLRLLIRNAGSGVPRRTILREVWGVEVDIVTRMVDQVVHRLRRKIEIDPRHPRHIKSVRKEGYRLDR